MPGGAGDGIHSRLNDTAPNILAETGFKPHTPRVSLPVVADTWQQKQYEKPPISMPARLGSTRASSSPGPMAATAARLTAFTPLGSRMGASLGASSSPASITSITPLGSTWLLRACTPDPLEQDLVPQDGAAGAGREERERGGERGRPRGAEREGERARARERERGDGAAGGGEALRAELGAIYINNASASVKKIAPVDSGMLL